MLERTPQSDEPKPKRDREIPWRVIAGAGIVTGIIAAGIAVSNDGPPVRAERIYAGVPAQVERRLQPTTRCSYTIGTGGACAQETITYKMQLEQCPADVEAARQGGSAESLDHTVGQIGSACISEIVQVPESIWNANITGAIIVFDGPPARPLHG